MMARIVSAAAVAELMGVSRATFTRSRALWERQGFPRPLPLPAVSARPRGRRKPPLRYDIAAIEAWLQRQRPVGERTLALPEGEDATAHERLAAWKAGRMAQMEA